MITRPMLAATIKDISLLRYPLGGTPKMDGIRCLIVGGKAVTRRFKPVPNVYIRTTLESLELPEGTDGELMAGDFQQTQSAVMTFSGTPSFTYNVFDVASGKPYFDRILDLPDDVIPVAPRLLECEADLLRYEEECLADGFEGVILRHPASPYKMGRSTLREGYMMKLKRVQDSEAIIVGFEEARENCNPIERNAFGLARRPGGKALKFPKDTLGSLLVVDGDVGFSIGTGFDDALRAEIWANRPAYLGRTITYSYQAIGVLERPRFPRFKGFRDE